MLTVQAQARFKAGPKSVLGSTLMSYVVARGLFALIVLYTERWKTTYGFACGLATSALVRRAQ